MKNILVVENNKDKELVRRIFEQRVAHDKVIAKGVLPKHVYNTIGDYIAILDKGRRDFITCDGAMVYDMTEEDKWKVYDFVKGECHEIGECDLAGLVNELPSDVFPFF